LVYSDFFESHVLNKKSRYHHYVLLILESTASPFIASRADVTTTYSGALSGGQVFNRPDGYPQEYYYFHAIQITVSTAGIYTFTSHSNMDTVGYLYDSSFDPSNPSANLIADDDNSGDGPRQFRIEAYLQGGRTYIVVVTTHEERVTGTFSISAVGPASVSLMSITPSTSRPIITRKLLSILFLCHLLSYELPFIFF
jgi:hypothetical protein